MLPVYNSNGMCPRMCERTSEIIIRNTCRFLMKVSQSIRAGHTDSYYLDMLKTKYSCAPCGITRDKVSIDYGKGNEGCHGERPVVHLLLKSLNHRLYNEFSIMGVQNVCSTWC